MAITYLRSWVSAQEMYQVRNGSYADADGQLFDAGLIDGRPEADIYGYTFSLDNPSGSQYTWWGRGWPDSPGTSGTRWFYVDQSGVIRYSTTGNADSNDPPI